MKSPLFVHNRHDQSAYPPMISQPSSPTGGQWAIEGQEYFLYPVKVPYAKLRVLVAGCFVAGSWFPVTSSRQAVLFENVRQLPPGNRKFVAGNKAFFFFCQ